MHMITLLKRGLGYPYGFIEIYSVIATVVPSPSNMGEILPGYQCDSHRAPHGDKFTGCIE